MNVRLGRNLLLAVILLSSGPMAVACLWDRDTRRMEEQQFPDALALITGGFLRHSTYFYEWRIEQRLAAIEKNPDKFELYDDLAVAYEKAGDTAKAIQITEELEKRDPGRYETLANLGTFYIHNGELERGVKYIDKALEINPDAHFGRERYQKYVVEYVLSKRDGGKLKLPLDTDYRGPASDNVGFTHFLFEQVKPKDESAQDAEVSKAIKGVLGMMRFGNYDSPVLLECLGDLLIYGGGGDSARHLATRAYLKAGYEVQDEDAKAEYRKLAEMATASISSSKNRRVSLEQIEQQFLVELKISEAWANEVFADEQQWVAAGDDVEAKYEEKYYTAPALAPDLLDDEEQQAALDAPSLKSSFVAGVAVIAVLALFLLWAMSHQYAKVNKANKDGSQTQ